MAEDLLVSGLLFLLALIPFPEIQLNSNLNKDQFIQRELLQFPAAVA